MSFNGEQLESALMEQQKRWMTFPSGLSKMKRPGERSQDDGVVTQHPQFACVMMDM
jgi:hypothetical protein